MKKQYQGILVYLALMLAFMWLFGQFSNSQQANTAYSYTQFVEAVEEGEVKSAQIAQNKEVPTGKVVFTLENGEQKNTNLSDVNKAEEHLRKHGVEVFFGDVEEENLLVTMGLPFLLSLVVVFVLFTLMNRQGGGGAKMADFGRSKAQMLGKGQVNTTFDHVAGLQEEKEDLQEIVDFLREPSKYIQVGARIPKGVLLEGPPGTGKTLMAKAIAGEAGVPFFSISGSDFVEMFVGVGASRVRDLFSEAKKNAPCIVFIDEIDAVARRRGTGMGGGHDEREQTLNQLLVEMDGFGVNSGIIVMAATNRVDILDPAILRPGRFDRKIGVGRPDVRGREEILKVHAKNKPLGDDVDLKQIDRKSVV